MKKKLDIITREILVELYINQKLTSDEVAEKLGITKRQLQFYFKKYLIPKNLSTDKERTCFNNNEKKKNR